MTILAMKRWAMKEYLMEREESLSKKELDPLSTLTNILKELMRHNFLILRENGKMRRIEWDSKVLERRSLIIHKNLMECQKHEEDIT